VIIAIDLIPVGTQTKAATPTMSPPPGTYNAAQFVALSDATSGAAIYYTTNGTTPTTFSAKYSSPIPVAATTTIKRIAVATGYTNSDVASTTYTITPPPPPITVSLATPANVYAFANAGSAVLGGGIDGHGDAYARNLTGPSITWNGSTFALGTADSKNGVRQTTVTLPAGNDTSLMLLATGVNGNQPNQTFAVNYADGTHTNFVQGLSDWHTPQSYNGESIAFTCKAGECSPTTWDGSKYTPHTIEGKSHGAPLSLGGVLYAWITPKSAEAGYQSFTLYRITDKACTWTKLPVSFDVATYGISFGSFVQFGKDNGSAINAYVYTVATAVSDSSSLALVQRPGSVMLLRVPVTSIDKQSAYEFFKGLDGNGQPLWSSDVHQAVPVYQDSDGVGPFPQVSYVPDLGQFVYTNQHGDGTTNLGFKSLLTMAEAPRPWGPWTDFYRNQFGGGQVDPTLFQWNFAPKWFRDGGRGFTLIFSGPDSNDSWNTVDGAFTISR